MRPVPCCDVLNMQFPTAKLAFSYHHPPTLHSAFFCLNWLTLTHINSSAAVTNAVLSLSFYLKTQTQDCQFYFTISIPLYFSQICTVLSEVILRPFLMPFYVTHAWGIIKVLFTELRVCHPGIKVDLKDSNGKV